MRKVIFVFFVFFLFFSCQKKEAYKKELSTESYKIVIISERPPFVGINKWKIFVYDKNGAPVSNVTVKVNGYMPPMPGMPEMSFDYPVKKVDNHFEGDINLNMAGTWQITVYIDNGKKEEKAVFGFNL